VRAAVRETVQRQADAGVDVLNDGEVSKPSYATYVEDRLTGFGGEGSIEEVAASVMGLDDFPDFAEKMAQTMASAAKIRFTSCDGPVGYIGQRAVQSDIENLKAAAEGVPAAATFMSAASPVLSPSSRRTGTTPARKNIWARSLTRCERNTRRSTARAS
jgi:5-methyltetrahydropteroyltriglutamate--homocysteine methyltransferase